MVLVLQTAIDLQSGPNSKLKLGLSRYIFPNVFGKRDKGFYQTSSSVIGRLSWLNCQLSSAR